MQDGDTSLKITAIGGDIQYDAEGRFLLRDSDKNMQPKTYKRIGMIAAGTGIAPMYQLT